MIEFKKLKNAKALYQEPDKIWVAKGMTFFAIDYEGKHVTKKYHVGGLKDRLLSCHRLPSQLLRVGIHHLLPLKNGNLLVVVKRKLYVIAGKESKEGKEGLVLNTWCAFNGNKPVHQGVCVTPDGTLFFGEYVLNPNRDMEVKLWRSLDNGMSFHVVKTFAPGEIRHIHFIKWDAYEKCIWMGTGDYGENNHECCLFRSEDNGNSWQLVGQGSQDWRAIGVCFTNESLMWGTDAGSCQDTVHFIRMDRKTREITVVADFEGPCHGCASYKDGRAFFSTGVEGGENELDKFSRMKQLVDGVPQNVWKLKKDCWPLILQYGVMRFPLGSDSCDKVVFTTMGLKGHGETIMIEK